eukprot:1157179-Pelagomonas_calceolata.AAC.14
MGRQTACMARFGKCDAEEWVGRHLAWLTLAIVMQNARTDHHAECTQQCMQHACSSICRIHAAAYAECMQQCTQQCCADDALAIMLAHMHLGML